MFKFSDTMSIFYKKYLGEISQNLKVTRHHPKEDILYSIYFIYIYILSIYTFYF
jgi:hypothetical protein